VNREKQSKDTPYLKDINQVLFQPVFILGVHRSGTSILYKMLVETGCFNSSTAYHLINYDELLFNHHEKREETEKQRLTESLVKKGVSDRGIDRLRLTADFAEEYGFLLGNRTLRMSLSKKNILLFIQLCKKIQFLAGNNKLLLLKNPYDFPNFLYIKQMFPSAKFVFIHRNPINTISSFLNAMRVIIKQKNPYTARLSQIYDLVFSNPLLLYPLRFLFCTLPVCAVVFLTRTTTRATRYYLKNIDMLPVEDYISITYEELCRHPVHIIQNIIEKLSISTPQTYDITSLMNPRKRQIDPSVQRLRRFIFKSMKAYYERFGYMYDK
jgi:hypothetical protein